MNTYSFEEKLAYEIGIKLAHDAYLTKLASGGVYHALKGGLQSLRAGQGFQAGAKQTFGQLLGDAGKATGNAIVHPFRDAAGKLSKGRIGNEHARNLSWGNILRKDSAGMAARLAGGAGVASVGAYALSGPNNAHNSQRPWIA